jgi:lactoylglutathione lyase
MKLVYTGIRVTNLKRSVKFYTRALGLKISHRGRMRHGGKFVNLLDRTTGQHLELNWYPRRSEFYKPYRNGEELDHIGFEVKDARESFSQLVSKGATPTVTPFFDGGWWMAFVRDPDGIWIELISRAGHRSSHKIWGKTRD